MSNAGSASFTGVINSAADIAQLNVGELKMGGATGLGGGLVLATEYLTGAGALSVSTPVSFLDTTGGAVAVTLAAPTTAGQVKYIIMSKDGGDATLTITDPVGTANTYVFANVGECIALICAADEDDAIVGWAEISRGSGAPAGDTAVAGLPAASTV